jgi:hypothetical protein
MPFPLFLLGLGPVSAAIAGIAHHVGKKRGYSEGYDDAEELSAGQIAEYKKSFNNCKKSVNKPRKDLKL